MKTLCLASTISLVFYARVVSAMSESSQLASANNDFAVKLYNAVKKQGENLVCSPLSLSIVLSMLLEGSPESSKTYSEIQNALQYSGLKQTDIENGYKDLLASLNSNNGYELSLADSIWIKQTFSVLDKYKQNVMNFFKAEANQLSDNGGGKQINKWVSDHTKNKITKLFDNDLSPDVVMVLVNAIYFEASWSKKFPKATLKAVFKSNDNQNSKTKVKYMEQTAQFPYTSSSSLNSQVLLLDYVKNEMTLVVILPNSASSGTLASLEQKLTSEVLDQAINGAESTRVSVTLPKFTITTSLELNVPLNNLGIKQAFSDQADFSQISAQGVKVSQVVQKAIIEVTENGTVAAAATGATGTTLSLPASDPIEFRADHPFIYVLYHKPTKSIIFIGRYTNAT